jgi:hypothetical protein
MRPRLAKLCRTSYWAVSDRKNRGRRWAFVTFSTGDARYVYTRLFRFQRERDFWAGRARKYVAILTVGFVTFHRSPEGV